MQNKRLELKLGGKVRPLLFDFRFLDILTEKQTIDDVDGLMKSKPWRYIPTLALAALQSGALFENQKEKFTYDQVADWVQNEEPGELHKIVVAYQSAMGFTWHAATGVGGLAKLQAQADAESQP